MNKDKYDKMDPLSITESLGIKTFRKSSRHIWSAEEDHQLTQYLLSITGKALGDINAEEVDWDLLASRLSKDGSRKPKDYKKRWTTSLDPNVKKGKWTKEEDEQLIRAYEKFGASWQKVAASIRTRTMDQCAKRYTEVLDPKTKDRLGPWTTEEELLLIKQVGIHGTKWRTVASHFKNRPALTCRNRWRKIVLSVVKDKADPYIKQEVEKITKNGTPGSPMQLSPNSNSNGHSNPNSNPPTANENGYGNPRESRVTTEWKYNLIGDNVPSVLENGGTVNSEALVHQLISIAKNNNLEISIHQHVHHHYSPPPHPYNHISNSEFGFYDFDSNTTATPVNKSYFLEPEAQLNRFQHFNYLPPLTEVPKLTSSSPDKKYRDSPSLTPLTQAVHLVVEQELEKKRKSGEDDSSSDKRMKYDSEDEDGMDFWEQIHNLGELSKNTKPVSTHHPLHSATPQPQFKEDSPSSNISKDVKSVTSEEDQTNFVYEHLVGNFGMIPFNPS